MKAGTEIWISDGGTSLWQAAIVVKVLSAEKLRIRYPDDVKEHDVLTKNIHLANPPHLLHSPDLISLTELNPPAILHTLQLRYVQNNFYSYCGPILISINPYQRFPQLYTKDTVASYRSQKNLPPHIYTIADNAYRAMTIKNRNQTILVSGESGAGKTEASKVLLQYFTSIANSNSNLEQKILQSTPILEAFGNAKTVWNDNSSRFGKFIKVEFDPAYNISGATIETYLLEKSRVVRVPANERNYHIFYQLLHAPQELRGKLFLSEAVDFYYLRSSGCYNISGVEDAAEFQRTAAALEAMGLQQLENLWTVLAIILHLGNVIFKGDEKSSVANTSVLATVATLLSCPIHEIEKALCTREVKSGQEKIIIPLNIEKAQQSRDTLAMLLYTKLFDYIVSKINTTMQHQAPTKSFIGILDIYGFECFEHNSFEQFCINYANEKLQQQFNHHIFKLEQEEYTKEGIDWKYVQYKDNQECIDLIEGSGPPGLISILDEETKFPKATHESFFTKIVAAHKKHINFKLPEVAESAFIIAHYAGRVKYATSVFLEKNRDAVAMEHLQLLQHSITFIAAFATVQIASPRPEESRTRSASQRNRAETRNSRGTLASLSVIAQFKESLSILMDLINKTEPHYIRCLKPNDWKEPNNFDGIRVLQQLRSGGVLEAVRVAASGFPTRMPIADFCDRYQLLFHNISRQQVREISLPGLDSQQLQFGLTRVFLRAGVLGLVESMRIECLNKAALRIQKNWRRYACHRKFLAIKGAVIVFQTLARSKQAQQYVKKRCAVHFVQKFFRTYFFWKNFRAKRHLAEILQCAIRGLQCRRLSQQKKCNDSIAIIYASVRGYLSRKNFLRKRTAIIFLQRWFRSCRRRSSSSILIRNSQYVTLQDDYQTLQEQFQLEKESWIQEREKFQSQQDILQHVWEQLVTEHQQLQENMLQEREKFQMQIGKLQAELRFHVKLQREAKNRENELEKSQALVREYQAQLMQKISVPVVGTENLQQELHVQKQLLALYQMRLKIFGAEASLPLEIEQLVRNNHQERYQNYILRQELEKMGCRVQELQRQIHLSP